MPFSSTAPSPASDTRSGFRLFRRSATLVPRPGRKLARTRKASAPRRRSRLAGWSWPGSTGAAAATAPDFMSARMRWRASRPAGRLPGSFSLLIERSLTDIRAGAKGDVDRRGGPRPELDEGLAALGARDALPPWERG